MRPSAYVETTVLGYLAAPPSRDLVWAARRLTTRAWWGACRPAFTLYGSDLVLAEAGAGDAAAAARRLGTARALARLPLTPDAAALAHALHAGIRLPPRAAADAAHFALAAVHGVSFFLTWDLRVLANAGLRRGMEAVCRDAGYAAPVIATPEALMGEKADAYETWELDAGAAHANADLPEPADWRSEDAAASPEDAVVADVRAARDVLFAAAGFDVEALFRRVRAREAEREPRGAAGARAAPESTGEGSGRGDAD